MNKLKKLYTIVAIISGIVICVIFLYSIKSNALHYKVNCFNDTTKVNAMSVYYNNNYYYVDKTKLIEDVLKVPAGTITEDTMIEDVEQWDSLAHVMIIGQLEEELGVSIPLDEAIDLKGMRELLEKAGCE